MTVVVPDEVEWLKSIPTLDYEPDEEQDKIFHTCHLYLHEGCSLALCGDTVNAHTAITLEAYRPGPRCHDCGRRRCDRCVQSI